MNWKKKYNSPRILTSILDDSGICGLWGKRASLPSKVWDALTWRKNCWLSPLTPPPQTLGMGSIGRNSTFFPVQHQHNPRGVKAPQLILQFKEGSNAFFTHFPGGGGVHLFPGVGSNRNPCNYNLWFSRGVWTPYPPSGSAHGHCGILARIGSDEPVRPPFKLKNFKC